MESLNKRLREPSRAKELVVFSVAIVPDVAVLHVLLGLLPVCLLLLHYHLRKLLQYVRPFVHILELLSELHNQINHRTHIGKHFGLELTEQRNTVHVNLEGTQSKGGSLYNFEPLLFQGLFELIEESQVASFIVTGVPLVLLAVAAVLDDDDVAVHINLLLMFWLWVSKSKNIPWHRRFSSSVSKWHLGDYLAHFLTNDYWNDKQGTH